MMRRAALALAILAFAVHPALAGFVINSFQIATASTPASITFLQCTSDTTALTTYTFASQNTGTASASRYTLVGVMGKDGATVYTTSTVTVGGDSATAVLDNGAASGNIDASLFILANTAGTSESVVVTFSEAITAATVCLWQVNDIASATAVDTSSATTGNSTAAITLDLDVSAYGIAAGVCAQSQNGGTWAWTGMTESFDTANAQFSPGAATYTEDSTASTPLAVTADPTNSSNNGCAVASFL